MQGVSDGALAVLVEKVRSQPQILGAYKRTAPMRSRESVMEFCAALACLKVGRPPFATPVTGADRLSQSVIPLRLDGRHATPT